MTERGIAPEAAMAPFVAPIAAFHERTRPRGWLEGLVKAYVGDGIAKDFYREMSAFVDEPTQAVMRSALEDARHADFVVQIVRDSIRTDRTTAGRLALWGRRLLGGRRLDAFQDAAPGADTGRRQSRASRTSSGPSSSGERGPSPLRRSQSSSTRWAAS